MRSEANFRLSECEPRRPVPPVTGQRAAQTHGGILRRERQRNVPNPRVLPPRLLQGWERLSRHRRLVLVPGLLMFAPPPDGLALHVDVRPPVLTDGADAVSGLVGDHQCHTESPVPTSGDTRSRASYSAWVRTTRFGLFSAGVFRPLRGLDSRRSLPSSSLDFAAQLRIASSIESDDLLQAAGRIQAFTARRIVYGSPVEVSLGEVAEREVPITRRWTQRKVTTTYPPSTTAVPSPAYSCALPKPHGKPHPLRHPKPAPER